ncbi:hypothetical protein V7787_51450, partial [Pseudomonas sp. CGJS7]
LLPRYFALAQGVRDAATPRTLVCRCEDVSLAQLDAHHDWRAAKLATRCGMGSCQGRICGAALAELRGFAPSLVSTPATPAHGARPPVFPTRLASLAGLSYSDDSAREPSPPGCNPINEPQGSVS